MSLVALKENLYTYIARNGKVDLPRLARWARENMMGILVLSILLKELEKEKKIRIVDRKIISKISINGKEDIIEIPTIVESIHVTHKQASKRSTRKSILESLLSVEAGEKKQKVTKVQEETDKITPKENQEKHVPTASLEIKREDQAKKEVEKKHVEVVPQKAHNVHSMEISRQNEETRQQVFEDIVKSINAELGNIEGIEEILYTTIAYLSKYWSVGELRIRLDISKMLSHKLGMSEEQLFEITGKVLKILRKHNIIEIVEPGIVNLIKKDVKVSPTRVKLLEVLGS